jgi:hypothetical protein
VSDFKLGYPNLATFKNSSDSFAVYRRFGYLQSRLLLEKQDILRVLEKRLDQYDRDNIATSYTRTLSADQLMPRQALLEEIEHAFNSYGKTSRRVAKKDVLTVGLSHHSQVLSTFDGRQSSDGSGVPQCTELHREQQTTAQN